jgi:hypothetical protein
MFIKLTDYHGNSLSLNPTKLLKLRPHWQIWAIQTVARWLIGESAVFSG